MLNFVVVSILFSCTHSLINGLDVPNKIVARTLLPTREYQCCKHEPYASQRDLPIIYCYLGSPKIVLNVWQTVSVLIDLNPEQYDLYEGSDSAEVWAQFEAHHSAWSLLHMLNMRQKHIRLEPFNTTCLGIRTSQDYNLRLSVVNVDYFLVAVFAVGVLLFILSPSLANNPLFYYLTGVSIGVFASVAVLLYFILKLLPLKKPALLGMMAGGSTIAFYFFQTFYDNLWLLTFKYQEYVIGYLLLSTLVSFVVCYRFGPVSNPRSINLIKWSLQGFGLFLIFFSSHFRELMLAVDLVLLAFYNIPVFRWVSGLMSFSSRLLFSSKSKTRLLTEEEFRAQGEVETTRGLAQLRDFCNSPGCRQWQTVLRLKDPHRFAKFMEGKCHLTKEEVENYEEESKQMMDLLLTDDSDED